MQTHCTVPFVIWTVSVPFPILVSVEFGNGRDGDEQEIVECDDNDWNGFVAAEDKLKGELDVVGERGIVKIEDNWSDEIGFGDDILSDEEIGADVVLQMEEINELLEDNI